MPWDFVLIFAVFAVIVPWRGWARMQRLLALPGITSRDRLRLYASSIATQWVIAGLIAWRALSRGLTWSSLGFKLQPASELFFVAIVGAILLGAAHWLNLRRIGRSKNPHVERVRCLAKKIFPQTNQETAVFCGLALTAGICEEFLYRGFVFAALSQLSAPKWAMLLVSSVLFGLAHAYQGRGGMLGTTVLGVIFGSLRILYDSLLPVTLWHIVVDVVAGFAGRRYLVGNE